MSEFGQALFSRSEEETVDFGEEFGREFVRENAVITVSGPLGAGKTHFIKGVARSLGIDEREVTSPTFTLVNEYGPLTWPLKGREENMAIAEQFSLFHLDCYRFAHAEDLLALGIEDYLYPQNAATIIEWPERIAALIPKSAIKVEIRVISEFEREINISLSY